MQCSALHQAAITSKLQALSGTTLGTLQRLPRQACGSLRHRLLSGKPDHVSQLSGPGRDSLRTLAWQWDAPLPACSSKDSQESKNMTSGGSRHQVEADSTAQAEPSTSGQHHQSPLAARESWSLASQHTQRLELKLLSLAAVGFAGSGLNFEQPGSVLQALGVLAAIVTIHECGHFVAARLQNIHVTKFSVGFGPALYTYKGPVVEYSLRAIPLGGYVAFPDDDPNSNFKPDDPDLLKNRSIPERAAVISAGVIANMIFAYLVLLIQISTLGKAESAYLPGVRIPDVIESSAAARAGFQSDDVILKIGDYTIPAEAGQVGVLVNRIRDSPAKEVAFKVRRGDQTLDLVATPDVGTDGRGRIGAQLAPVTYIKHVAAKGAADVLSITGAEFKRLTGTVLTGLSSIATNFNSAAGQLTGPVAMVAAGSEIARQDSAGLFQFCAIVNINLAVVNLLPLPALDGGYLMLLFIEAVRGKKLPEKLENTVMASGLLLLMVAGIGLVIKDTINLL